MNGAMGVRSPSGTLRYSSIDTSGSTNVASLDNEEHDGVDAECCVGVGASSGDEYGDI